MLPYGRQTIDDSDIEAVVRVLKSDWLTTGPAIEQFEAAVAARTESQHAIAVSSGTAALHAAMHALEIGPGDEVIVPALTFAATANAVLYQGGIPVFADVDRQTMLLDVNSVADRINAQTKAIVAVDFGGTPCDYGALQPLAKRHGLALVADACHSLGGSYQGRPVGSLADISCFSLHPVKPITTGEGGLITTNRADWAARIRRFRGHGIESDFRQRATANRHDYQMVDLGFNYRMTDLQAALGLSQLNKLDAFIDRRASLAAHYQDLLSTRDCCFSRPQPGNCRSAWHLFVVHWTGAATDRDSAFYALRARQIGVNVHYKPVYWHPFYRDVLGYAPGQCPQAEAAYQTCLTLPLFPQMTASDVERVVQACDEVGRASQRRAA